MPCPIPPYPRCSKNYNALVKKIGVQVPEVHEFRDLPSVKRYVDKAFQEELSIDDAADLIFDECCVIRQKVVPEKLADPGGFLLDCTIGSRKFDGVLCDSGSSVNVIPLSAAKDLGEIQPCPLTITFADQSVREAEGMIIDVPIEIGDCKILADFVVMKLDKEPKEPLILGRGFLATAGAVIDFRNGLVHLHLPGKTLYFKMDRGKEVTVDSKPYEVNTISAITPEEKVFARGEEKEKVVGQPKLSTTSTGQGTAIERKAPTVMPSPSEQRYAFSRTKTKSKRAFAGRTSKTPTANTASSTIPRFLSKPHASDAYTPPWMKRHSTPLSEPPEH